MTNFKPLKDKIWEAVKSDDKAAFDQACEDLMEKAAKDIWRIGWSFMPSTIEQVFGLFKDVGKWCHERWIEAMNNGDAPPEDVSPAEAFIMLSKTIKEAIENHNLPPNEITEWWHDGSDSNEEEDDDIVVVKDNPVSEVKEL